MEKELERRQKKDRIYEIGVTVGTEPRLCLACSTNQVCQKQLGDLPKPHRTSAGRGTGGPAMENSSNQESEEAKREERKRRKKKGSHQRGKSGCVIAVRAGLSAHLVVSQRLDEENPRCPLCTGLCSFTSALPLHHLPLLFTVHGFFPHSVSTLGFFFSIFSIQMSGKC